MIPYVYEDNTHLTRHHMKQSHLYKIILLAACLMPLASDAGPRSPQAMLRIAQAHLAKAYSGLPHRAPAKQPELLRTDSCFRIYGYKGGQFVIVSTDDEMPAVLGYSDNATSFSEKANPNFEWWLGEVREATQEARSTGTTYQVIPPGNLNYEPSVAPLVTARWGQQEPYNNFCPYAQFDTNLSVDSGRSVTGCVATAMAQILYYHKGPQHGVGKHSVGVPFDYPTRTYTVDFGSTTYDWANMKNDYSTNYTQAEADAVATLMFHCGVASDMQYSPDASGTYLANAADGLKRNFGLSDEVHVVERSDYSETDWMDMVYHEISQNRPILYGGVSGWDGGHAFVIDGYNEDGLVHVNWGWNGNYNGMFDIATLAVQSYRFSSNQNMCIGISPERQLLNGDTITLHVAGTLADSIPVEKLTKTGILKVNGVINSSDLKTIRFMAGVDEHGRMTKGQLNTIDLSGARFVSGGDPYLIEDNDKYFTSDDELPERAFYGLSRLSKLVLPSDLRHIGDGALAIPGLRELGLTADDKADFYLKDDVVYSKADSSDVIAVLPYKSGYLTLNVGTKTLHPYAMANCRGLAGLRIASTVESVGEYAFANMTGLNEIRVYAKVPPVMGNNAVTGLDFHKCKLYVPAGSKNRYGSNSQWGQFKSDNNSGSFDNIVEFGTRVKARNAFKIYGDPAPRLGYKIEGDRVHGVPEVTTDVDERTPVGRWPIRISRGTIQEQEGVEYADGYVVVAPDTLFASVGDYTRDANAPDPVFKVNITGFDNGEDSTAIEVMPWAKSSANAFSPAGVYEIALGGGKADNYIFAYTSGKLTITGVVDSIDKTPYGSKAKGSAVFNLTGQKVGAASEAGLLPKGVYIVKGRKFVVR